jgi:hypothetical protein
VREARWTYSALRAAWENSVIVKEHGRLVAKNITQAERLVYTDGPEAARPVRFRDDRSWRRASAKSRKGSVDKVCVRRMHDLLERDKTLTVCLAGARVAVEFWISGPTFETVVKRLDRAYRRAKPILVSRVLSGDISEVWTNRRQPQEVCPVVQKVSKYTRS